MYHITVVSRISFIFVSRTVDIQAPCKAQLKALVRNSVVAKVVLFVHGSGVVIETVQLKVHHTILLAVRLGISVASNQVDEVICP